MARVVRIPLAEGGHLHVEVDEVRFGTHHDTTTIDQKLDDQLKVFSQACA